MKNGLSIGSARISSSAPSDENISEFSSRGWSSDGRIKPDLMTPGYNSSAANDGNVGGAVNCTVTGGGGTSYASPVAVGVAALVRQYFTEGFYPSGAKNDADKLTPTAALVKATMINSGVSMTGSDNAGGPISPIPSNEQGWGRIRLDQSLVFAGGVRRLRIDDHRATWAAGATTPVTYTVTGVTAGQQLKATLVWTDYPGVPDSPPSAQPVIDDPSTWNAARLVNDLDLKVQGPSGTYLGNVFTDGASTTGGTADRRNNVEQVLIAATAAGDYTITVTPFSIVQDGQDFALVVTWGEPAGPGTADGGTDGGDGSSDATSDASDGEGASDAWDGNGTGAGGSGGADGSDGAGDSIGTGGTGGAGGTAGAGGTGGGGGATDAGTDDRGSTSDGSADVSTDGAGGAGGTGGTNAGGSAGAGGSNAGGSAGRGGGGASGSSGSSGSSGTGGIGASGSAGTAGSSGSAGANRDAGDSGPGSGGAGRDASATDGSGGAGTDAGTDDSDARDGCSCSLGRRNAMPSSHWLGLVGVPLLVATRLRRIKRAIRRGPAPSGRDRTSHPRSVTSA
jgi:hypothetical protein